MTAIQSKPWHYVAVLSIALLLSACAGSGPHNSTSDGTDSILMLKGHDPVAYFTLGKLTPGRVWDAMMRVQFPQPGKGGKAS